MKRKMKNLTGKIVLDLLAFFGMSLAYLLGRILAFFSDRGGMI